MDEAQNLSTGFSDFTLLMRKRLLKLNLPARKCSTLFWLNSSTIKNPLISFAGKTLKQNNNRFPGGTTVLQDTGKWQTVNESSSLDNNFHYSKRCG